MQTFLPDSDFYRSARTLDRARLGKQRVECKQLLLALGVSAGEHRPVRSKAEHQSSSWSHHPAAKMWRGYEHCLAYYGMVMASEWISRGYRDSLHPQFKAIWDYKVVQFPRWYRDRELLERVCSSHRSNLLRKDPEWYGKFNWKEPDNLPYVWPNQTDYQVLMDSVR